MKTKLSEQAYNLIEHNTSLFKRIFCIILGLFVVSGGLFLFFEYKKGCFSSIDTFQDYVKGYGWAGPLFLTVFQCLKVIYAVIPGTLGYIVGPALFGPILGILCNYVGICLGSCIAFMLSRHFGIALVKQLFSVRKYNRCMRYIERHNKNYGLFLWIAILIPVSPDDFLCYFSGLTKIKFRNFLFILLTSKPWIIIVYSLIFGNLFN